MSRGGLVTIVFTDLVGSTALAQDLGDAVADRLRREHFGCLRRAVEATGGTEVKNIGDALMVSYTSAADALDGAVVMQQNVEEQNRTGDGPRLAMRVGMSVGDATFEDGDWFGAPVVEASRLVDAAEGGQILTTDIVRVLAGSRTSHEVRPFGEVEAKGLPHPIAASEVVWAPRAVSADAAGDLRVALPPVAEQADRFDFVGRESEFGQLVTAWTEARSGARRAVLVAGEPGIGKTRLVKETCRLAHEQGAIVLWGGSEDELGIPFQPFSEAIREFVHSTPPDALRGLLGPLGGELARLVPQLPRFVADLPEPMSTDPEAERHRLFDAVGDLLGELTDRAPVVFVLDDLHWAGKPTLLLLRHLLRRTEQEPLLVVITYRDTDLDRTHPLADMLADLRRQSGVTRLSLAGLDPDGVVSFMERLAGHEIGDEGRELAAALHTETEGNPFFVGEVLLHLTESGALVSRDGRWTRDTDLVEVDIPEGVREVVGRRLSHLDPATNEVLTAAAVMGREFDLGVLAAVVEGGREAVLDALDRAESSGLVAPGTAGPGSYRFAHALVRSTLSEELPTGRRLRLHRDLARALAARTDTGERLAELARHFGEAAALGEVDNAVRWGRRAGAAAVAELAWDDAIAHYERAFDALAVADDVDPVLRGDLLVDLGTALRVIKDPRADDVIREAVELAGGGDDAARFADAVLLYCSDRHVRGPYHDEDRLAMVERALDRIDRGDDARRAQLVSALAGELLFTPEHDLRRHLADEALALARSIGDREVLGVVLSQRSHGLDTRDGPVLDRALVDLAEGIDLAEELGRKDLLCHLYVQRVPGLVTRGSRDEGEADLRRAEDLARELRHAELEERTLAQRTALTLLSGRLAEAEVLLEALRESEQFHETDDWRSPVLAYRLHYERGTLGKLEELFEALAEANPGMPAYRTALSGIYVTTDRPEQAREHLRALAADDWAIVPRYPLWSVTIAGAALVAGLTGELEIAAETLEMGKDHVDRICWTGASYEHPVAMCLATAAAALGRFDDAEALFAKAIDLCERAAFPTMVADTRAHWASSILPRGAPGDADTARELATAALATAEELGLGWVATQSRRVLDQV